MDSDRWERIQALFHDAVDLPPSEQRSFLEKACGGDESLMVDVAAMLAEEARGDSFLDRGMAQVANQLLDPDVPAAPAFGELGPYRIVGVLGEGGMGVVYLAEREDLGIRVAIKLMRDAWLSPARRERFTSEQRMLAQLNHPSIARLYDADTLANGTPFFVMEFVEGVPLTEYCNRHQCSIERRLQLFRAVCEAVQYAHSHAVIHRDLKPSNILVKEDGSIRLLDFGIAKQVESLDLATDETMTGLRLMTLAYAAPEQIRGSRVGIQSDVYSLGMILYELMAGGPPFDLSSLSTSQAEAVLLEQEPAKPSTKARQSSADGESSSPALGKAAWADLDVLCLTAMHKDMARRYRSVEALIRDIDHYLQGAPLEARLDSARYRIRKFVTRNQRAVAVTVATVAIAVGLVIFFTVRLAKARNDALAEAARTQRIQRFTLDLFKGGDEAAGPSEELRVVTLLDRGVQEAQLLSGEPGAQAELFETLGGIYQKLGKYDRAASLLLSALGERKKLGADNRSVAETLVLLSLLRADQAKYDDAEQFARQGLEMSQRHLPPNHPQVAKATFALGKVLEDRGRYDQAIQVLDQAAKLQSAPRALPADLAATLSELANTNFYAGHYDVSETLNQRVLGMQRQIYGERHPLVADTLINLGAIQFQLGHYPESERFNRQALDIVQSWYGKDHPETADTMTILGQSLTYQQRFEEAAALLKQSRAILEHTYGPVHPRVAYALNELGNVAIRQGKLDDAEAYFRQTMDIYRSVYGDTHYQVGIAQSNLGGIYVERKDYVRAEQFFRDALKTYSSTLAGDHSSVAISRIRLGTALLGQRRFAEAQQESRAGYETLTKKASPTVKWLQTARKDLVAEYDALHQPEEAAKFRDMAAADSKNAEFAGKK